MKHVMNERMATVSCKSDVNTFEQMIKEHNLKRSDSKRAAIKMGVFLAAAIFANYY